MPMNNTALNFLRVNHDQQIKAKAEKVAQAKTREFKPNENGFYTMQLCYIIDNMLLNGANIDTNGHLTYIKKGETNPTNYIITDIEKYNQSVEIYGALRENGVKNITEILKFSDNEIQVIQKIQGIYKLTTITGDSITSEDYTKPTTELKQFTKI